MYHIFFIHSSVDRCLGCFHVLAIVNSAAMNTGVHVSFRIRVFVFPEYMPRSGIVGSCGWMLLDHMIQQEMEASQFGYFDTFPGHPHCLAPCLQLNRDRATLC